MRHLLATSHFSEIDIAMLPSHLYDPSEITVNITKDRIDMRNYGLKARLAQEFSGFTGSSKVFRDRFDVKTDDQYHRSYTAADIRKIRFKLLDIPESTSQPRSIPPIITARMAKGGTGKTTIVGNISACMAMYGHKVLLIDGDPQASLTGLFGIDWVHENITHIGELMRRCAKGEKINARDAVRQLYDGGMLDIIPADITLADADSWLMPAANRENAFKRLLDKEIDFFSQYDVIIIDGAPSTSLLINTFMVASKTLLAVVVPEGPSLRALEILASNVQEINDNFSSQGVNLDIHIVVNRYNQSKKPHNEALSMLAGRYSNLLNDVIVRDFVGFVRQMDLFDEKKSGPVIENEPLSIGSRDIIDLTKSLIKLYDVRLAGIDTTHMSPKRS